MEGVGYPNLDNVVLVYAGTKKPLFPFGAEDAYDTLSLPQLQKSLLTRLPNSREGAFVIGNGYPGLFSTAFDAAFCHGHTFIDVSMKRHAKRY